MNLSGATEEEFEEGVDLILRGDYLEDNTYRYIYGRAVEAARDFLLERPDLPTPWVSFTAGDADIEIWWKDYDAEGKEIHVRFRYDGVIVQNDLEPLL
jgi:hypothetical protein